MSTFDIWFISLWSAAVVVVAFIGTWQNDMKRK